MTLNEPSSRPPARNVDEAMEQLDTHGIHRRHFVKVLAGSLAAAAGGGLLAACGSDSSSATAAGSAAGGAGAVADGKLAILSWSAVGDYAVQWQKAYDAAAKELGFKETVALDGKFDAGTQLNQFNQLLTQQSTVGILIGANDPGAVPTLARSASRGQVLFNSGWGAPAWYTPWDAPDDYYNAFLLPDEYDNISKTTTLLIEAINEEGSIARVGGSLSNDASEKQRRLAVLDTVAKHPKVKLVGELQSKYDPDLAQKQAAQLLAKYPDIVGIVAVNDDVASGVVAGIKASGKVPGKDVLVIGSNGSTDGINRVQAGTQLATTGNVPAYPSFVTVAQFYDRLNGWKPKQAERQYGWVAEIITKENVDVYKARYVDGPIAKSFSATLLSRTKTPKDWDLQFGAYPIEDLEKLWPDIPKPKGYKLPKLYLEAQKSGQFDEIRALYKEHYKTPVLGPAPTV
jgi:ribose transport system substrate-binding protein